ncbi:hypothetical protein Desti_3833 [Desulfomonile tiedjei DSM 6799]|uniref:Uncharacterized protein n=1 Tax=Desulfomonile tiedjei (strain ATCC 49306 / DSM 6799 / DCB-1) TaxID=706587 RepID=I4CA84_DESTA|nr:hypothetical protein Desti_3833 [Desulfomonile tiedjei DSM 6799]
MVHICIVESILLDLPLEERGIHSVIGEKKGLKPRRGRTNSSHGCSPWNRMPQSLANDPSGVAQERNNSRSIIGETLPGSAITRSRYIVSVG